MYNNNNKIYRNKDLFSKIVAESFTLSEIMKTLNITCIGGNYNTCKRWIKFYNLDTSHFIKGSWSRGKKLGPKIPVTYYLQNKTKITSFKLKLKLIEAGLVKEQCQNCLLTLWLKEKIPLELHHIDGDSSNNLLENLQLLCPNCHAKTDTYRGKNRKSRLLT